MKLETTIIRTLLLIALIMGLYSCQFNKSVEKDLTTGAFLSGDGISTDNVVVEINGKAEKRNEFVFGEKVNLVFENVEGLTKKEGKMFPGLSMYIIKNEKDTVVSNTDLLKNLDSGTAISPLELNANFMTALTSKNNEKYKVHVTIWDKNGTGTLRYELPFTVKESNLLTIKNSGLTFSNIYLWNETLQETVTTNKVNSDHLLILIMNGVEGMKVVDGKVFPLLSLELTDSMDNKIISNPNILSSIENTGATVSDLKHQVTAKLSFTGKGFNNPCTLKTVLKDKYSSSEVVVETELVIK